MTAIAPQETLNKVIGALMLGTLINCMLFMLEILEVHKYFRMYPKDPPVIKVAIAVCLLLDATCTFAQWACIYLYGVIHWGDLDYLGYQNLVIPVYIYTSGILGCIVQNYLISRYYKLTGRKIVCGALMFMTLAALVGSVWCATQLSIVTDYAHRSVAVTSAILWLASSAATDVSIASALVFQLRSAGARTAFKQTRSLINRLIFYTIQTGSFTTAIAICVLVTYLHDTNANVCVGFGFTLGRLYTLTMLFNLNNRSLMRDGKSTEGSSGQQQHTPNNDISLHGITIHRTAIVHIDDEERATSTHEVDNKRPSDYGPFNDYANSKTNVTNDLVVPPQLPVKA
ncbi:hypothetical protein FB45DRAFT_859745 [Roridomyces roridus]|uniref:DUF6534 domain-containing protein n=1 Tax=Roridomyces roridus TaxID=1738132 RepID=A0AAD7G2V1_9AGAR|nr:hypothetical protein FB45DRAFT_859745 [Roridomyces roridus]